MRKKLQSKKYPLILSKRQLSLLRVAANCRLRRYSAGWLVDGYRQRAGERTRLYSAATIRTLLEMKLLDGNARGKKIALEGCDEKFPLAQPVGFLWTSEEGRRVLEKLDEGSELALDDETRQSIELESLEEAADCIHLGHFSTEREALLAHDRWAILIFGDDAETHFLPEESERVTFSDDIMRQINAAKARRKLPGCPLLSCTASSLGKPMAQIPRGGARQREHAGRHGIKPKTVAKRRPASACPAMTAGDQGNRARGFLAKKKKR